MDKLNRETSMLEKDQYNSVCKPEFEEIKDMLNKIHNRLFIDNGTECIQSKLNYHGKVIKIIAWGIGVMYVAIVGVLVRYFI